MFTSLKQRILLGVYIFILISVPIGTYLVSQATQLKSKAYESSTSKTITQEPKTSSNTKLLDALSGLTKSGSNQNKTSVANEPAGTDTDTGTTMAVSYGPTLSLKIQIDGRPQENQSTKLFIGIVAGADTRSPQYLLSFSADVPENGTFGNLSLAGLTTGNTYTAILKGDAQIATSSAFIMSPTETHLNNNQAIGMLSGDLNQDNVINGSDLQIAQAAMGSTSNSSNWNPIADLNKDGMINGLDLAIINRNMGKVGVTGAWASTPVNTATSSASLTDQNPPAGSPDGSQGYWVWVPK